MSLKDELKLNKPRRTPSHATKSHVVKTNVDGKPKMIRFGEQGAKTAGAPSPNDSAADKAKRKSFKARHASNIAKGPASAAYWADRVKWAEGGPVNRPQLFRGLPDEPYQPPSSVTNVIGDVLTDTASGIFGPIAASAYSLGNQYFTDKSVEELEADKAAVDKALNYSPRTAGAQAVNEYTMGKMSEGVTALAEKYNENKDRLGPIPDMIDYGVEQYNTLDPETRFAIGNALTVGEVVPIGKVAGMAKRGVQGAVDTGRINRAADLVPDESAYLPLQDRLEEMGARQLAVDDVPPVEDVAVVLTDTPHRLTPMAREVADKRIALEKEMALLEAERSGKKPKTVRTLVKIDDLAKTFDEDHINVHGRKLDPTAPEDQLTAAKLIAADIDEQMTQANSGAGWYDADVQKTYEMLGEIPGLEELKNNETKRIIWSALAAPTSIGQKVIGNTKAATAAMLTYARTGEIPTAAPIKDTVTQGIKNAGWGFKQKSVEPGMKVISTLLKKYGEEGFADWWLSPHTLKELTDIRKEAGLSGGPSGLSGGKDSIHLGAMVLGDKTGRFSLNINGYEGTTKDVWYSRSYNRAFGQMFGATDPKTGLPEVQGGPRNQTERRQMEAFNQLVLDNTALEGLSEADAQAVLWFFEQGLYSRLGVESRPGSFSEGVGEVYGSLGLRQPVRGSDGIEIEIEPPAALDNFRDTSGRQRAVRANRRVGVDASADSSSGNLPQSGPYGRGSTGGDGSDGLLVFEADQATLAKFQAAGLSVPTISQVDSPSNAVTYNADMVAAMAGNRFGPQVEIKSAEDLSQANLFRTPDGSGFAIKPDGDIVAVFASPGEPKGGSYAMLQAAVQAGGTKLDAFDTYLPDIYESVGFRPVARLAWNDDYAPEGWDKDVFKKYNNGEPDVVFFVHDPSYFGGAKDVPVVADYDQAVSLQDQALEKLTSASGSKPKGSGGSGSNDSGLSIAQEIATMLASGRTDGVTDELLDSLDYNDTMELFELYKSGATGVAMPMDTASRDARAEAMFPRDDYYHGTNADIKGFQGNVFSSENPTLASTYARGSADAQIYPLRLGSKLGDTVVEGGGVNWNQLNPDEIYKTDPAVAEWLGYDELSDSSGRVSTRGVERAAMREGRSGVQFKDINDIGPGFNSNQFKNLGYTKEQERDLQRQYMEDLSKPSNVDVRLSPNLVRSKFARFDPRLANLKNLSAGVALPGAGLLALQEMQKRANEEQQRQGLLQ